MGTNSIFKESPRPTNDLFELLLTGKAINMLNTDALISLLIQKGVFTKAEFDSVKQALKETDEYREIEKFVDQSVESLQTGFEPSILSDKEIENLLKALSESEMEDMQESINKECRKETAKKRKHIHFRDVVFIAKYQLKRIAIKIRAGKFPRKPT